MGFLVSKMHIICDVIIVLLVILCASLFTSGYLTINKQGFYCDDRSISYPKADESFKSRTFLGVLVLPAAAIISIVEVSISPDASQRSLKMRFRRFARFYLAFFYSMLFGLTIVVALKSLTGELRPHFLDTCKPDFSRINCSAGHIIEYDCTSGASHAVLEEVYRSFPSAHAAGAFLIATFLILYLDKHLDGRPTSLTVFLMQTILSAFASTISMRRISEHQHHWWDVVIGVLIGIFAGVYGFNTFRPKADATENA